MSRAQAMCLLLFLIGVAAVAKGILFFATHQYDQLFFLGCGVAWVAWIVIAVFKNWNLPAPFAYDQGTNQVGRVIYCIIVIGIYVFLIFIG